MLSAARTPVPAPVNRGAAAGRPALGAHKHAHAHMLAAAVGTTVPAAEKPSASQQPPPRLGPPPQEGRGRKGPPVLSAARPTSPVQPHCPPPTAGRPPSAPAAQLGSARGEVPAWAPPTAGGKPHPRRKNRRGNACPGWVQNLAWIPNESKLTFVNICVQHRLRARYLING
ncbi:uncharacterized protein LOC111749738 [Loxodonta africana]|uniref:uncharacterized protein LOC111749738 n=1 Tax=Loxodonta africana TaxID=9785 RepID=UPI0030CDC1A6